MEVITLYEFAALVARLRRLQVKYLQTRQRLTLDSIHDLERLIDAVLVRIQANADELNRQLSGGSNGKDNL